MAADQPTLRALLRRRDLDLRLVSAEGSLPERALDRALRWVHSSDLADPTPFLADDLALLTTGTQFDVPSSIEAYVARIAARGVLGLGFGTEVHRNGIPAELVGASAAHGIPLFEVPYRTPFIAVARAHSEAMATQAYARRTWALETQRGLALAALRPRGLDATFAELSRRLGVWTGMFDAAGSLLHSHPREQVEARVLDLLGERVAEVLVRGLEAGQSHMIDERTFMLFTIGRGRQLRGVIALETGTIDAEARSVVTSVIAMAGLALGQGDHLTRTRRLHSQLLRSLLADDPALARRVLGGLPTTPIVIGVAGEVPLGPLWEWWERYRLEHHSLAFLAESDDGATMVVCAEDQPVFDEVAERFGVRIGVSAAGGYGAFSRAHAQAATALRQGRSTVSRYADAVGSGILSALATAEARLVAETRLAPLRAHDARTGTRLEETVRTWLALDAHAEQAASALGIHRHTLRSRLARTAELLDVDLATFPARAEVWALLQTARD